MGPASWGATVSLQPGQASPRAALRCQLFAMKAPQRDEASWDLLRAACTELQEAQMNVRLRAQGVDGFLSGKVILFPHLPL